MLALSLASSNGVATGVHLVGTAASAGTGAPTALAPAALKVAHSANVPGTSRRERGSGTPALGTAVVGTGMKLGMTGPRIPGMSIGMVLQPCIAA